MANQSGGTAGDIEGQDDDCSCKGFLAKTMSLLHTLFTTAIPRFLWSIVKPFYFPFKPIFSILKCFYFILICGRTDYLYYDGYPCNEDDNNQRGSRIKTKKAAIKVRIHRLTIVTAVRMGCLVLLWMVINLAVPYLRRVTVLGSLLWKWSLLSALILLAYPFLTCLFCKIYVDIIQELFAGYRGTNVEYYTDFVTQGLILALYFTSLFLAWFLCVDTTNPRVHRYGTLTLVSLLVGGVLSLLKSSVLLWWRTKLIYVKYREMILSAGCQLYFNLLLMDQNPGRATLVDWLLWEIENPQEFVPVDPKSKEMEDQERRPNWRKILPIADYMSKQGASTMNVHEVATYLTNNFELSLTEDDDIPDIVPYLRRTYRTGFRPGCSLTETHSFISETDEKLLRVLLQLEIPRESTPSYDNFEKWMVDGLKYSYAVGNRIDGAFQAMRILSRVMTIFIVVAVILVWLLITRLATTKVVVGLATVFLALTFVFGDACKTFFQGVIFSFVTHPFDVADRCIIDDKELKVKKINILTTTFFGSQSKEIILYPNSDLATKRIMLLHGEQEFEPNPERKAKTEADLVEFSLPPQTTSSEIESLQDTIERHLKDGSQSGLDKKSYCVSLVEFGDNIKMQVNFEHVLLSDGGTSEHSESIETRKQKQRSKLVIQLKKFVEGLRK